MLSIKGSTDEPGKPHNGFPNLQMFRYEFPAVEQDTILMVEYVSAVYEYDTAFLTIGKTYLGEIGFKRTNENLNSNFQFDSHHIPFTGSEPSKTLYASQAIRLYGRQGDVLYVAVPKVPDGDTGGAKIDVSGVMLTSAS